MIFEGSANAEAADRVARARKRLFIIAISLR
jgi:hypothetical protein